LWKEEGLCQEKIMKKRAFVLAVQQPTLRKPPAAAPYFPGFSHRPGIAE
jgi:hypothetical protein